MRKIFYILSIALMMSACGGKDAETAENTPVNPIDSLLDEYAAATKSICSILDRAKEGDVSIASELPEASKRVHDLSIKLSAKATEMTEDQAKIKKELDRLRTDALQQLRSDDKDNTSKSVDITSKTKDLPTPVVNVKKVENLKKKDISKLRRK